MCLKVAWKFWYTVSLKKHCFVSPSGILIHRWRQELRALCVQDWRTLIWGAARLFAGVTAVPRPGGEDLCGRKIGTAGEWGSLQKNLESWKEMELYPESCREILWLPPSVLWLYFHLWMFGLCFIDDGQLWARSNMRRVGAEDKSVKCWEDSSRACLESRISWTSCFLKLKNQQKEMLTEPSLCAKVFI